MIPILLAGGAGTRLWPVSRDTYPKQFLPLIGNRSTYQQALLRVSDCKLFAAPIVITGPDFQFFAQRQADELGIDATIIVEPMRRDSAAAIAAATAVARQRDPDAVVLALAADHIILDVEPFRNTCVAGREAAEFGRIVTFGIKPTEPKTSYGYILCGEAIGSHGVHAVARFVEKPDAANAARYLIEGYLWNSGNFLFRADVFLDELARFEPAIATAAELAAKNAQQDLGFLRLDPVAFASAPQKSVDYAVMEKTDRAAVVVGDFRWSDIGSWDALFDVAARDSDDNVIEGDGVTLDAKRCVIYSPGRLTAVIGVDDLVVVNTPDAVLVVPRARSQAVRDMVNKLKANERPEASVHRLVYRPWGYHETMDAGDHFHINRVVVDPGGTLTRQTHQHRAEHWVVLRGTAEVTIDDDCRTVNANESIYIPIGSVHRLANRGAVALEIIEVQSGSYLGEDDIVRLDEVYKLKT